MGRFCVYCGNELIHKLNQCGFCGAPKKKPDFNHKQYEPYTKSYKQIETTIEDDSSNLTIVGERCILFGLTGFIIAFFILLFVVL